MRSILMVLASTLCLMYSLPVAKSQEVEERPIPNQKQTVLVELFTSERCGSCPPAEKTLTFLGKEQPVPNVEIVTLALHVDYLDSFPWKDRFSSKVYTLRQEDYGKAFDLGSIYAPQMIVGGREQFIGHNRARAVRAVKRAARDQKGVITAVLADFDLTVVVSDLPNHKRADVYLATVEDGLPPDPNGDHKDNDLEYSAVVRELKLLGTIEAKSGKMKFENKISWDDSWKGENRRFVAFVQERRSRKILAAAQIR